MAAYHTICSLKHVYLEDSFVLSVSATPRAVEFIVEVVLKEDHPEYAAPLRGEQYCYKGARLRFVGIQGVNWIMSEVEEARDATGQIDYGGFDVFESSGNGFHLEGDFGSLTIDSGTCELILGR